MLGIVGSGLAAIIGAASTGWTGFIIGLTLPALITAIIGLARHRRTWLNLGRGGLIVATSVMSAVLLITAVASPASTTASNIAQRGTGSHARTGATANPATHAPSSLPEPTTSPTTAANPASDQAAINVLATLAVQTPSASAGYDRVVDFGEAWLDVDHNGCDTRDDILARDLTSIAKQGSCTVGSGILHDPYTATTIDFTRGVETSRAVQIDHVVPLGDAWVTGGSLLTEDQRISLANDPLNLLAVDGPANESKGDKDASQWLPPNASYDCDYVARQVAVKATYHLWVSQAEHDKMASILGSCPNETMPISAFASGPTVIAPTPQPSPAQAAAPAPAPAAPAPAAPAPAAPAPPAAPPAAGVVHPGAFCSPAGAIGVTSAGTPMICGTTAASPDRARWHAAG